MWSSFSDQQGLSFPTLKYYIQHTFFFKKSKTKKQQPILPWLGQGSSAQVSHSAGRQVHSMGGSHFGVQLLQMTNTVEITDSNSKDMHGGPPGMHIVLPLLSLKPFNTKPLSLVMKGTRNNLPLSCVYFKQLELCIKDKEPAREPKCLYFSTCNSTFFADFQYTILNIFLARQRGWGNHCLWAAWPLCTIELSSFNWSIRAHQS